jgi:hypothetical protein
MRGLASWVDPSRKSCRSETMPYLPSADSPKNRRTLPGLPPPLGRRSVTSVTSVTNSASAARAKEKRGGLLRPVALFSNLGKGAGSGGPITFVKSISTIFSLPPRRSPLCIRRRWNFPVAGHPLIAIIAPSPIAGNPQVLGGRTGENNFRLVCRRSLSNNDYGLVLRLSLNLTARHGRLGGDRHWLGHRRGDHRGCVRRGRRGGGDHMRFRFGRAAREEERQSAASKQRRG